MARKKRKNSLVQELSDADELKRLRKQVVQLEGALDELRSAKFHLPTGKPRTPRSSFCRVCIPDTHGCLLDKDAWKAFIADLAAIQPAEIIWLGDHLDCGGFLAQHHTLSYYDQAGYTFAEDAAAANIQLDQVIQAVPGAKHWYIEGNHERRIETWIVTQTLRNEKDARYLRTMFSPEVVLGLEKRGFQYIRQGSTYDGLSIPNVFKLGKCYFTHGIFTNKNAAKSHVDEYGCNIVYAHTHRADSYIRRTIESTIGAYNPGCLCIKQKMYNHSRNTHWTHGYGIQAVQKGGSFLHINVPIVDGKSLLQPLAKGVA